MHPSKGDPFMVGGKGSGGHFCPHYLKWVLCLWHNPDYFLKAESRKPQCSAGECLDSDVSKSARVISLELANSR